MRAAEKFWDDVSNGLIPVALPATISGDERAMLVGVTLRPQPTSFAALHSADVRTRMMATIAATTSSGRLVEKQYPRIKVVK